ncbi:zinc finger BED domain-containing protein 4-like [Melanotaenia boesemani]|uniref:zinc finger BED domain-containing protein 4-like n=1 Tax=Melanotaenia boesemani TaxID=1250792 RepID=UPI001C03F446|nr:zinc finger BED domain-containing protein 4-like [Melanotaenia boesemani]XP_041862701.1 zinc finger BED domain-containing protein 4-like [Melanotaenia boesemani]
MFFCRSQNPITYITYFAAYNGAVCVCSDVASAFLLTEHVRKSKINMSAVWKFYTVCDSDIKFASCNTCDGKIPRGGSTAKTFNTTNLIRHLKNNHLAEYGEFTRLAAQSEKKTPGAARAQLRQTTIANARPYERDSQKAKLITTKIMEFIGLDDQPFSVVEDTGFRRLLSHLEPRYLLPGRKYFMDVALPELHQTVYAHIERLLKEGLSSSVSFTTDIWSSDVSPVSLLSLTAHWIDSDFHLHKAVLHAQEFSGSHTAVALAATFEKMFETWHIPKDKVHVILRDNARNMVKGMTDAGLPSLGCMAHTLQLAIHEAVLSQRSISDIIAKGRRIVGHFRHSPLAYARLQSVQQQLGQPTKRLQQDVSTRWNSTYYMLVSLLEQKRALGVYAADHELPATFTTSQWELIENLTTLLQPFEELTKEISSSNASAADVIPAVMVLKRLLAKETAAGHGVKTTKDTLLEAVTRRFADIEEEPLYSLATLIDPRYKDRFYSEDLKTNTHRLLVGLMTQATQRSPKQRPEADSTGEPAEKVPRPGSLSSVFGEILGEESRHQVLTENATPSEMIIYLSEPTISRSASPLEYWKANKERFPGLASVARAYLSAPCTSVESERLFSAASNIVDEHRNRLMPEKAEMLLFIKKNLPTMLNK